ncbi:hypothetical protein N8707_01225 [Candidatus Pelagibacter sp.]|nr:hypothetical protein [Candidatus Pelagibacter sp.]MDA7597089.1 hypothetical protein [Candidatus Pelagibacter sp.]
MANLKTKTELYLIANSKTWDNTKVSLQDDMVDGVSSPYIKTWTYDIAQPTAEQIASYETAANAAETNAGIDATRQTQYLSWQQQMEMIYKDQKNGTTTFKDHCDKVRSDNPKS